MVCIAFLLSIIILIYPQMSSAKIKKIHFFHSSKYTIYGGVGFGKLGILTNPKFRPLETNLHEMIFSKMTARGRVSVFSNLTFYPFYVIIFT